MDQGANSVPFPKEGVRGEYVFKETIISLLIGKYDIYNFNFS